MIKITNLGKKYGENTLFQDFNLEIENGEYVIIVGKSGHGKTTLLNMIGAIEPYDTGSIIVNDVDLSMKKNHKNYYRNQVSFLFQNFALIENKTVLQNLLIVKKKGVGKDRILAELAKFGLEDKLNQKVYTLSGGEQQRVALIRLILQDNPIILADEPTGSLDSENGAYVLEKLAELNEIGKTIVLVTHDDYVRKQGNRLLEI